MLNIARVPITNIYADGDYTARIQVGAEQRPMNVLLDTGSSQLALNVRSYRPGDGDATTHLAQSGVYLDGSYWTGAVVETKISIGQEGTNVVLDRARVAVAYRSRGMFGRTDGILGLAYSALDDAYLLPEDTWQKRYDRIGQGKLRHVVPYLKQLEKKDVVSDKFAFLTRRSTVRVGHGDIGDDIMNQGWMIVGGGEESIDLYTGDFQAVKVLSDSYYNTNLKAIAVEGADAIAVPPKHTKTLPSNSIVDSGTAGMQLPTKLMDAVVSKFRSEHQALLRRGLRNRAIANAELDLGEWPDIVFVMQGRTGGSDANLRVKPRDYWQRDAGEKGAAQLTFMAGDASDGIVLGLPLMNGYFTIFDGEADGGRGEIRFAVRKD